MKTTSKIHGIVFEFSDADVRRAVAVMKSGKNDRVKYYANVDDKHYPLRHLLVEMLRIKGVTMPDIGPYRAMRILRALGFKITEE